MIDYIQVQDEAPQKEEETLKNSDIEISTEGKTSEDYNYSLSDLSNEVQHSDEKVDLTQYTSTYWQKKREANYNQIH